MACGQALEFLDRFAGGNFAEFAHQSITSRYEEIDAVIGVAAQLLAWAEFSDAGLAAALPYEARARIDAATDLMEQVQRLLDDAKVHPAAPVMLAGAALEALLRSMLVNCSVAPAGKPGIGSYSIALRKGGLITANDEKDIAAWGGQRNEAAHGDFAKLTVPRAQIMVDGINLFMRQRVPTTP